MYAPRPSATRTQQDQQRIVRHACVDVLYRRLPPHADGRCRTAAAARSTSVNQKIIAPWSAVSVMRPVVGILRPDRDQILLLREPVRHVQERCRGCPGCRSRGSSAKSLSPTTTTRVSGFGRVGRRAAPARRAPAREHGGRERRSGRPCRPWRDPASACRSRSSPLMSVSAQLCGLGLEHLLRDVAARAAFDRRDRARQREGRHHAEVLGDRVRHRHGDRHRRVRADQLAEAARVDDDVVADVDAPFLGERDEVRRSARRRPCPADRSAARSLPPRLQERAERIELRREEVRSVGPATTTTVASSGTLPACASVSLATSKLSLLSAVGDAAVARRARTPSGRARRGPGRSRSSSPCPR